MAFGEIGLTPHEFWRMSLNEFKSTQRGFFEKKKQEYQAKWERARFIAFYGLQPHLKRGRLRSFKDLIQFDWEKNDDVELPTREEMEAFRKRYGEIKS